MRRFESRLPEALYDALMNRAEKEGTTAAELTRKALGRFLGVSTATEAIFDVPRNVKPYGKQEGGTFYLSTGAVEEIRHVALSKGKLEAIKWARNTTPCSLHEARWIVEHLPSS